MPNRVLCSKDLVCQWRCLDSTSFRLRSLSSVTLILSIGRNKIRKISVELFMLYILHPTPPARHGTDRKETHPRQNKLLSPYSSPGSKVTKQSCQCNAHLTSRRHTHFKKKNLLIRSHMKCKKKPSHSWRGAPNIGCCTLRPASRVPRRALRAAASEATCARAPHERNKKRKTWLKCHGL